MDITIKFLRSGELSFMAMGNTFSKPDRQYKLFSKELPPLPSALNHSHWLVDWERHFYKVGTGRALF